jgi:hypothetical protein
MKARIVPGLHTFLAPFSASAVLFGPWELSLVGSAQAVLLCSLPVRLGRGDSAVSD